MSALDDIVIEPDERLHTVCEPIEEITPDIREFAERMLEAMYEADGCGLAAPQLGRTIRMYVVDCDYGEGPEYKNPYVLINPEILVADGELETSREGCLSYPGILVPVERPTHVVVQATNLDGELMRYEAQDNLMATCLQHEYDHLEGITMIDHLPVAQRGQALTSYKRALELGAKPGMTDVEGE